jgi:hypothetical protein
MKNEQTPTTPRHVKLLRRWTSTNRPIKVREEQELIALGLIEWATATAPGYYASFKRLTEAGRIALKRKQP